MTTLLAQALKLTGATEGGFTIDHAGPTNLGITIPFLTDYWRYKKLPGIPTERDIRALKQDVADAAYEALIWDPLKCGFMPAGVGYVVFDTAVNSGATQAALWLQRLVKALPDGQIGPKTLAAINQTDPVAIITGMAKYRSALMLGMNNAIEEKFEKGWHVRLIDMVATAILINLGKYKG